jgi:hypothetical protein
MAEREVFMRVSSLLQQCVKELGHDTNTGRRVDKSAHECANL